MAAARSRRRAAAALVTALALAGCQGDGGAPRPVGPLGDATPAADEPDRAADPGAALAVAPTGVPHAGSIAALAVDPRGRAALSLDHLGGLRLWPALDGSAPPWVVPVRGARDLSLAVGADGPLAAVVDAAGAVHIVDGRKIRAAGTPHQPARQVEVLPAGDAVLVLGRDHRLRVLDRSGAELAELEARQYRPEALRLTSDAAAAVTAERQSDGTVLFRRVAVERGPAGFALTLAEGAVEVAGVASTERGQWALRGDGGALAFFAPDDPDTLGVELDVAVVELGGERVTAKLPIQASQQRALGFVADDAVAVTAASGNRSWRVDAASGRALPIASPVDHDPERAADAFAPGLRLAGAGQWLFTQRTDDGAQRYLGYAAFAPSRAAIAPGGAVAWIESTDGSVYVEPGDGSVARLVAPERRAYQQLAFVDDRRLALADSGGGVSLVDWRTGARLATAALDGPAQYMALGPRRRLLALNGQRGGTWVFAVRGDELVGPRLIADASVRSGFAGDVVWTLDGSQTLRRYRRGEVQRGVDQERLGEPGVQVAGSSYATTTVDPAGRALAVRYQDGGLRLVVDAGSADEHSAELRETAFWLEPSPDGARVAVGTQSGAVQVHDLPGGELAWTASYGRGGIASAAWAADGATLAIAGSLGGALHDATDGSPRRTTCGLRFESRDSPPLLTHAGREEPLVCEH